jgi:chromosome segregation ATPase
MDTEYMSIYLLLTFKLPTYQRVSFMYVEIKSLKDKCENLEKEATKSTSLLTDLKAKLEAAKSEETLRKEEMKTMKSESKGLEARHRELQAAYDKLEEENNSNKEKLVTSRKKANDAMLTVYPSRSIISINIFLEGLIEIMSCF